MSPPPSGAQLPLLPSFACSAVAACIAEATTIPLDTAKVRLQMQGGVLKGGEAPKYRRVCGGTCLEAAPRRCEAFSRADALARVRCARRGLLGTVSTVAREEGVAALWKGLEPGAPLVRLARATRARASHAPRRTAQRGPRLAHAAHAVLLLPGLHRQCMFGGLRIGLYEPVKKLIVGKDHVGDVGLGQKIVAGLFTGARARASPRFERRCCFERWPLTLASCTRCCCAGALAITIASPTDLVKVRMQTEGKLAPGCVRAARGSAAVCTRARR